MIQMGATVTRKGGSAGKIQQCLLRNGNKVELGLRLAANVLFDASQEKVPRDTEALAASARIQQEGSGFDTRMQVGYGRLGFSLREFSRHEQRVVDRIPYKYALYVHEGAPFPCLTGEIDFLRGPAYSHVNEMRDAFRSAF